MIQKLLAGMALSCAAAWSAAPFYNPASIVNTGDYAPGPFAPNSIVSLFGTGLAISTHTLSPEDISNNTLPTEFNSTRVYVDDMPVPLFYVSPTQINFLISSKQGLGPAVVRVVREGLTGPEVTITVAASAPALFINSDHTDYAIVSHQDWSLAAPGSPAHAGDIVFIWATGLGKTEVNPQTGQLPPYLSEIVNKGSLKVTIGGTAVDPKDIFYAGLTPDSAGLYQINLRLPALDTADPEIRIAIGSQSTPAGLKLAFAPAR